MNQKSVLITGAATGIGKEAARELLARGHRVIATCYQPAEVEPLSKELGAAADVFALDITKADDRAKASTLDVDVLINNAAQGASGSLAEVDIGTVRGLFETNLFSTLELTQSVIRRMIERGGGTIVFMSSIAGRVPLPFVMPYGMTKFALSAAAAGLRKEMRLLDKGIHVAVVEPGPFKTGFNQQMNNSRFEWMKKQSLFSREQVVTLEAAATRELRWAETGSTKPVVRKIVAAAEASRPRLRYVAPWHAALLVRLMRIFGV